MNLDKIQELFEQYSSYNNFSGLALIKTGDKEIFSYSNGYANKGFKIKNNRHTKFDTASITKLFTSVAIFQFIEKGLLNLDDEILDLLDIGDTSISKKVTIYHLLTHTSGIGDDADEESGENYSDIWIDKPNYSVRELVDFLPQFIHKEPNFEPGYGCRYNNCAFILLGLVIEKLSGKTYHDYIHENIFKKSSMNETFFYSMDEIHENVAEGYVGIKDEHDNVIGFKKNIYSYPPRGASDAGAYTTVDDLDKFFRALLNNTLLSEETTNNILKSQCIYRKTNNRIMYMGYAFEHIARISDEKVFSIQKDGSNDGVACLTSYLPEIDTIFTILANTDACDIWSLAYETRKHLGINVK